MITRRGLLGRLLLGGAAVGVAAAETKKKKQGLSDGDITFPLEETTVTTLTAVSAEWEPPRVLWNETEVVYFNEKDTGGAPIGFQTGYVETGEVICRVVEFVVTGGQPLSGKWVPKGRR